MSWKAVAIGSWIAVVVSILYILFYPIAQMAVMHEQKITNIISYINSQEQLKQQQLKLAGEKKDATGNK